MKFKTIDNPTYLIVTDQNNNQVWRQRYNKQVLLTLEGEEIADCVVCKKTFRDQENAWFSRETRIFNCTRLSCSVFSEGHHSTEEAFSETYIKWKQIELGKTYLPKGINGSHWLVKIIKENQNGTANS